MKKNKGFTLIELLVVISIISLLSSVVLASLQSARDKGRVASIVIFDTNNYRKIGVSAIASYTFDNASNYGKDNSGNNYDLSLLGGATGDSTSVYGNLGGASLSLASAGQYASVSLPTSVSVMGQNSKGFTISLWTKASSNIGNRFLLRLNNTNGYSIFCDTTGRINFFFSSSLIQTTVGSICTDLSNYHNITYVYDTSLGATVYIDGKSVATNTAVIAPFSLTQIDLGRSGFGFIGNIDTVRIYNDSLLALATHQIYAQGLPTHSLANSK